ncbi:MAG: hypothetical protein ACK2T5_08370 [Anaerolineales bacterium]|jgi:hypothetical protein
MVTKTKSEIQIQDELVVEVPGVEISEEANEKIQQITQQYKAFLLERTNAFVQRSRMRVQTEATHPLLPSEYQYWNCLSVGPYQLTGSPSYLPSNIVEGGELCLMIGAIWINPADGPGASLPGTIVLGDRDYRFRFESINLTDVANGPDFTHVGTFPSPANEVTVIPWVFSPADPGINPRLYEVNLTVDILQTGQPLATFGSWHRDPSTEPAFLGEPTMGPHDQFERPARFLVYRK